VDLRFYVFAVIAVMLVGLGKGGFSGLGTLATPVIALAIDPVRGAAILLPILIVQDAVGVAVFRRSFDKDILAVMIPAGIVGIVIGYVFAVSVSERAVLATVGITFILFAVQQLTGRQGHALLASPTSPRWVGALFGVATGFASQIAHAGAPPFQMWVLPRRLSRDVFVGTSSILFATLNWAKVPAYIALGQFDRANLTVSLTLMPVAIAASLGGVWLVRRVRVERFYTILYSLMALTGVKLLADGLGLGG
jgi:uncharacterized protein